MPLIQSDYRPPWYWRNRHVQTIVPNRLRRLSGVPYVVEPTLLGAETVDLYWSRVSSDAVAVVAHGLGGHVHRSYVRGMIRRLNQAGFDACTWHVWNNDRASSPHFYHGGTTDGLRAIVESLVDRYDRVALVGFSLGGNVVLKYLGEEGADSKVHRAVTFSVPCELESACIRLSEPANRVYLNSFLKTLKRTVRSKASLMPDRVSVEGLDRIRSLMDYDDRYTAPLNGFPDAHAYYSACSSIRFIADIRTPTLLVNAGNDPFLTEACYPVEICQNHPYVSLEVPASGGHVGFPLGGGMYWSEERAAGYLGASG